ncbi:hypothetical protein [Rhodococcus sp. NPDC058521]
MRVEDRYRGALDEGDRNARKEVLFYVLIAMFVLLTLALVITPGLATGS